VVGNDVETRVVEVFADVWCPFTHVGLRRLVEERARLGRDDVAFRVRAWPLELVNGEPMSAELVAEEVEALRAAVAPELFRGLDLRRFPSTTLPALALAAAAYRRDDRTGEQVSLRLRWALFEEGRNIADRDELATIAATAGVDLPDPSGEQAVLDDWQDGQRRGVIGSPYFFADGNGYFCPTLRVERIHGTLQVVVNAERVAEFTAAAFA
jgi:predicted DsbA family dithiol-disulfide isomerase